MQLKKIILFCGISLLLISGCNSDNEKNQRYDVINSLIENFEGRTALYYKSRKGLPQPITLPISKNTLKAYDQVDAYNVDSLVTQQDISAWNKSIKNSSPVKWDSTKLSGIKIVNEEPAYLEDPIPDPDKTPYPIKQVLHISVPFFNSNHDKALLFLLEQGRTLNFSQFYFIMGRKNNQWKIIARGFINGG